MAKQDSVLRTAILLVCIGALRLGAQVVETPIPFDSAGKIRSITPALAERFHLAPPTWPLSGDFVEARLFSVSDGGTVLVGQRRSGALERYALRDDERDALRETIDRAMTETGALVSEAQVQSPNARGAFVRNQMILSAIVYGPLLASLTSDGKAATAVYLLSVSGSYFLLSSLPKTMSVTRAQNHLATDGALRGYFLANGVLATVGDSGMDYKVHNGIGLAGAIGMSAFGFARGRRLTDSDAEATTKFSTMAGATAFGIAGAAGQFHDNGNERLIAGVTTATGVAGYLMGPRYPRHASYTVTAGDVQTLPVGFVLGAAAGATPFIDADNERAGFAAATAGALAGAVLVDRVLVRSFDYGTSDATQLWLGTIAGALAGAAVDVLTVPDAAAAAGFVTLGGMLGAVAGHHLADPPRASARRASGASGPRRVGPARLHFDLTGAAFAAMKAPGRYALLTATF